MNIIEENRQLIDRVSKGTLTGDMARLVMRLAETTNRLAFFEEEVRNCEYDSYGHPRKSFSFGREEMISLFAGMSHLEERRNERGKAKAETSIPGASPDKPMGNFSEVED